MAANGLAPPSIARALAAIAHRHRPPASPSPHGRPGPRRLTDGGGTATVIDAPQALVLRQDPRADIERYDALRDREVRHAS